MKIKIDSNERGLTNLGWLKSHHSFSFGSYHNPKRVQHGALRVLNDDSVEAGRGFGAHPHRNAEILSYVISGELEHRDSLGNGDRIKPGEFQYMSAGRGVTHSEYNPGSEPVHFLQVWLLPADLDTKPNYKKANSADIATQNGLKLIAAKSDEAPIHWLANAQLWLGEAKQESRITLPSQAPYGYLHLIKGEISQDKFQLSAGDGLATHGPDSVEILTRQDAQFLWFQTEQS
ncbi:pirin family protein [Cerasicoccus frondis]|uniref:pirin family protein n=1 Tax=Cerasicoccus frondis TaxID=490090 RepID=UPI002852AD8C|nr:pirin family protein [Cerasicoccus frondis]